MASTLQLRLLGSPTLSASGKETQLRLGKKSLALLALLASPVGKRFVREEVAGLLWPDRFDEQARQSLRQSLSDIRKGLGTREAIVSEDGDVWLSESLVSTDIEKFEHCAHADEVNALEEAAKLYRGDFLERVHSISSEFDDWATIQRTRLRNLVIAANEKLLNLYLNEKKYDEAATAAERLLLVEAVNEVAHRTIMSRYMRAGRAAAALRQYELCRATLARTMDAEPEQATQQLADEIRSHSSSSALLHVQGRALGAQAAVSQRPGLFTIAAAILIVPMLMGYFYFRGSIWESPKFEGAEAENVCGILSRASEANTPALLFLPIDSSFTTNTINHDLPFILQESLRSALLMVGGVSVIEGPPSGHPDLDLSVKEIALKHGATHVFKGALRPAGDGGGVRLWIIEASTGHVIWDNLHRFGVEEFDVTTLQNQAIYGLVRAVQLHVTDGPQTTRYLSYEVADIETFRRNTKAYTLISTLNPSNVDEARAEYQEAMSLQPNDPGAYNGYAMSYLIPVLFGWSQNSVADIAIAIENAEKAREINPEYPYLYSTLGLLAMINGDYENAVNYGSRAIQLSENNADGAVILAFILTFTGEAAQAEGLARRAISLRPYNAPNWQKWALARAMRLNGNPEGAARCLEGTGAIQSGAPLPTFELIIALSEAGDIKKAKGAFMVLKTILGDNIITASQYCGWPPRAQPEVQTACVDALVRVGIPD